MEGIECINGSFELQIAIDQTVRQIMEEIEVKGNVFDDNVQMIS